MSNITIIIPIHEIENNEEYLNSAINSIITQKKVNELPKLLIVAAATIVDNLNELIKAYTDKLDIEIISNDDKTDYQSQVNLGVKSVETDYFTVLEFDDMIGDTYIFNGEKYIDQYGDDVDIFLTMIVEVDSNNNGLKTTNDSVWAQQFVGENGEIGYLNTNALKSYTDFKLSGAIINKDEFINIGGYKSNIKLTFMYEFLLRALNNTSVIYTIPKIGYKHVADREGSMFDVYSKEMDIKERKFWFDTAAKESNFINDRVIEVNYK